MDDQRQAHHPDSSNKANHKPNGAPAYLTYGELSRLTGISVSTLRRRVKDGSLPFFQPGGRRSRIVFPGDAVERVVSSAPVLPDADPPPIPKTPRYGPEPKWLREL